MKRNNIHYDDNGLPYITFQSEALPGMKNDTRLLHGAALISS